VDNQANGIRNFVILYTDNILFIYHPHFLSDLHRMFPVCERELTLLTINAKKSCCLRIEPRFDADCSNISTATGIAL
jgi:hypothetical protein